jgi:hypothetical protein
MDGGHLSGHCRAAAGLQCAGDLAGAPVDTKAPCKANIDIVFTPQPQTLLDQIRKDHPVLLGSHDVSQAQRLATVSHPIQAWYTTQTEDLRGMRQIDDPRHNRGVDMILPYPSYVGQRVSLPSAREENIDSGHLGDRLRSSFYHVVIVADLHKVADHEMGALADYIAVLALSQPQSFDGCTAQPSITNLMSPACDAAGKSQAVTGLDVAYLRSLYKTDTGSTFGQQQADIADRMGKDLAGR